MSFNLPTRILLHLAVWLGFWLLPSLAHHNSTLALQKFLPGLSCFALVFYVNYFLIIPKCILSGKGPFPIFRLLSSNLILIALVSQLLQLNHWHLLPHPNEFKPLPPEHLDVPSHPHHRPFFLDFIVLGLSAAMASILRFYDQMQFNHLRHQELSKEMLQSELNYLKLQISPHFLFNTLNNIYSQIDLGPDKAQDSILNLSKLLRYMLYETDKEHVLLKDEIHFLNSYIELMNLRLSSQENIALHCKIQTEQAEVPPLLLLPLVENAYKHGIGANGECAFQFKLSEYTDSWIFECSNLNFPNPKNAKDSGIGLANLKKRLDVLYQGRARFHSEVQGNLYLAELHIPKEMS